MLQDAHSRKVSLPIEVSAGDNIIIAALPDAWIYVHEVIGDLSANGTLEIYAGSRLLAEFALDGGQGLTITDEPGEDNRPRFECKPGEAFRFVTTGGTFTGACHYSIRY